MRERVSQALIGNLVDCRHQTIRKSSSQTRRNAQEAKGANQTVTKLEIFRTINFDQKKKIIRLIHEA